MLQVKVQPQLLRNLLHVETDNDHDYMFVFSLNEKELHFVKREFAAVSGLKYGKKSNFFSDVEVPNKLTFYYFPSQTKVKRSEFYRKFDDKDIFMDEDLYNLGMIYFINRFLVPNLPRNFILKNYFDLVERGEYLNYPWVMSD
ncbi:hypothetical protein P3L10_020743 [Capsicum annuum]